jgi:large subunit ribosomal protein L17
MRHRSNKKILSRKKAPREAMLRSLATSVILYEKVKTTQAKAKVVRPIVERLITHSKSNTLNARRKLTETLYHKKAVAKALEVLGPRYIDRKGGYTRITKLGKRQGDGAEMAQIEFV